MTKSYSLVNKTFTQPRNKMEFKAPLDVVQRIYESGAFISNGQKDQICVRRVNKVTGKCEYLGQLKDIIKGTKAIVKDGNGRNVTRGNLKLKK
jgi:hypothetical protein